jgi:Ubiquitin-2 like Rad60 SUMO-like
MRPLLMSKHLNSTHILSPLIYTSHYLLKIPDLPNCKGGDRVRLICMGKGYLMPDSRTLEDCQIPVFRTHPTPINVSVIPEVANGSKQDEKESKKKKDEGRNSGTARSSASSGVAGGTTAEADQGCSCSIL